MVQEEEGVTGLLAGPQGILISLSMPAFGFLFTHAVQLIAERFDLPNIAAQAAQAMQRIATAFNPVIADAT